MSSDHAWFFSPRLLFNMHPFAYTPHNTFEYFLLIYSYQETKNTNNRLKKDLPSTELPKKSRMEGHIGALVNDDLVREIALLAWLNKSEAGEDMFRLITGGSVAFLLA